MSKTKVEVNISEATKFFEGYFKEKTKYIIEQEILKAQEEIKRKLIQSASEVHLKLHKLSPDNENNLILKMEFNNEEN